jgi:hypothetical protein
MIGKTVLHLPQPKGKPDVGTMPGKRAKNACQDDINKWVDQHKAEARRDPLRFHAVVVPRIIAALDAIKIPENDFLARRLAAGKRAFLAPYLTLPPENARIWYQRRQRRRALDAVKPSEADFIVAPLLAPKDVS